MEKLPQTPSQTIGPFFAYSLTAEQYGYDFNSVFNGVLQGEDTKGERIYITGRVFDGNGEAVSDAMIELWQADAAGDYLNQFPAGKMAEKAFKGFGRTGTGTRTGQQFIFVTIKPGAVNGQAPHINVMLSMRGSLHVLYTRFYFPDEMNDNDPVLNSVAAARRQTLLAQKTALNGAVGYCFNINLQGENETVFFNVLDAM
jgi:protocatechuate 3,4-dioxygenase, alpha subunit